MMSNQKIPFALVTGAAIRLGKAIALSLIDKGFAVGLHYHQSEKEAGKLKKQLQCAEKKHIFLKADLSNPDDIQKMADEINKHGYSVSLLINSAAIMPRSSLFETNLDDWNQVMNVNLRAAWLLAKVFQASLTRNRGLIINISDSGISKVWTKHPIYLLSKIGIDSLTKIMARTLAPEVRVNAIAPGLVLPSEDFSQDQWDQLVQKMPLEKSVLVEDVISAVHFCLDNQSITGQTIVVDSGYQLT